MTQFNCEDNNQRPTKKLGETWKLGKAKTLIQRGNGQFSLPTTQTRRPYDKTCERAKTFSCSTNVFFSNITKLTFTVAESLNKQLKLDQS